MLLAGWLAAWSAVAVPQIERWETSNGGRVLYVHTPQLPIVDIRVIFDAGSARDGAQGGLASLTNGLLSSGAANRGEEMIAETVDRLGAQLGFESLRDMALISLRSLSDGELLDPALALVSDLIHQPFFPQSAFERERSRQLVGIQSQKQSPATIANQAFFRALYGKHPYAEPSSGTEESVKGLKRSDLRRFHGEYYVGKNAIVAIVGDLERGRAKEVAEQIIGRLPSGEKAAPLQKATIARPGETLYTRYPSVQSHLLMGHPVLRRGDPDYFDLYVGNHMLGGSGLTSKISEELREARGLAYSAYSYFSPMRGEGPFKAGLQTKNENRDEALEVLRETITRFVTLGPTAEMLERSKKNITGGFPLRIDSNKKIVEYLGMIGFYGLPADYLNTFNRNVEQTTVESIQDAFKRRLHPTAMVTIVVGGPVN
ncbi:MAG: insulinase family protein [Gammaproteobacteria bacterium]|nr:insulinase family protein [Gammaproteobacteria bacterium]